MDLELSPDQAAILDALDGLSKQHASAGVECREYVLQNDGLDQALSEGGFLDVAYDPDLGALTAALIVERLARLPVTVETAASALVRPLLGELPRPICLVDAARLTHPVRFLKPGATVILLHTDKVETFTATESDVTPVHESLYAYPVATLNLGGGFEGRTQLHNIPADEVRTRWQIAIAAEAAGLLGAAVDATVQYVSERKQFGRPIGVFQAVRHRLAEDSVRAMGARWLALKAAHSGDAGDAALALHFAQDSASQAVYDLHQFLGGMGMTLEHPLHLWTYRLKALVSDLGGRHAQAVAAADAIWGEVA